LATTYYYGTYYPTSKSLPCGTSSECVLSYATGMFNGYTETLAGLSFGNAFENASWAIVILLALPFIAIITHYEKYLNLVVASMVISQVIFFLIYPTLIEPHLTSNPFFGGGLSLFGTFSLIVIAAFLLLRFYKIQKEDKVINGIMDFALMAGIPLLVFTEVPYLTLSISNIIYFNNPKATFSPLTILLSFVMLAILLGYIFYIYFSYKRRANYYKINPKLLTGRIVFFCLLIGFTLSILFASYLLPVFIFYKGLALKGILNPHNFGWPVFAVVTLILMKANLFMPKNKHP
jgi:hypothetical protein